MKKFILVAAATLAALALVFTGCPNGDDGDGVPSGYYRVTFLLDYPDAENPDPVLIPQGEEAEWGLLVLFPAAPVREGYGFIGWFKQDGTRFIASTPVTGNITVTAQWVVAVTITFDTSEEGPDIDPIVINTGTSLGGLLPSEPVKPGHAFLGWFLDSDTENEVTPTTTFDQDTTLVAQWRVRPFFYVDLTQLRSSGDFGGQFPGGAPDYDWGPNDELIWTFNTTNQRGLIELTDEQHEIVMTYGEPLGSFIVSFDADATSPTAPFRLFLACRFVGSSWNGTSNTANHPFNTFDNFLFQLNPHTSDNLPAGVEPGNLWRHIMLQSRSGNEVTITIRSIRIYY